MGYRVEGAWGAPSRAPTPSVLPRQECDSSLPPSPHNPQSPLAGCVAQGTALPLWAQLVMSWTDPHSQPGL